MRWCHSHDKECEKIAANAQALHKRFLCKDGVMDYLQSICVEISKRWRKVPAWVRSDTDDEDIQLPPSTENIPQYCDHRHRKNCNACEALQDHEDSIKLNDLPVNTSVKVDSKTRRKQLNDYRRSQKKNVEVFL